jgi:uncharacterized protein with von Willebrand factor type A (vWA) domain
LSATPIVSSPVRAADRVGTRWSTISRSLGGQEHTSESSVAAADSVRAAVARSSLRNYTDYGRSLVRFHDAVHSELGHRSTVLVLGDAQGNNLAAGTWALAAIARRAGSVYWLNPERSTM